MNTTDYKDKLEKLKLRYLLGVFRDPSIYKRYRFYFDKMKTGIHHYSKSEQESHYKESFWD